MTDPWQLPATESRRLIGRKQLSAEELAASTLERIEQQNSKLNAFVSIDAESLVNSARDADQKTMSAMQSNLPTLHGLPIGIKDLIDAKGFRTTFGSLLFKDNPIAAADDPIVDRLRDNGAIVVGKTNTPEFGDGAHTTNLVFGPTRNPHDVDRTAGGSSGGSAAAVASGMAAMATGSDSGGSLRTPASFCGVVGFRSTPSLVPSDRRPLGWTVLGVQGPIARTVDDVGLMLAGMAATSTLDPLSRDVDERQFSDLQPLDTARLRLGLSEDLGVAPVDREIRSGFRQRAALMADVFQSTHELSLNFPDLHKVYWTIRSHGFLANHGAKYDQFGQELTASVRHCVEEGRALSADDIAWTQNEHTRFFREFQRQFETCDVILSPAVAVPPFDLSVDYPKVVDGEYMPDHIRWIAITYATSLAASPSVVIPCGNDHTGAPYSLQVIGPYGRDLFTLRVAKMLEEVFAGTDAYSPPTVGQ